MSSPDVKSLAVLNAVREVAEALEFAETKLTLEESEIELLPDVALTMSSASEESESEVVVVVGEDELSSDFAQPMITKLMIPRKRSKLVKFFILTSLNNKINNQKSQNQQGLISF